MDEKKTIMLIDDDQLLLDMHAMKFEKGGYEVDKITDPAVALEKLKNGKNPDIIAFDVVMPGMDGWDFLKILREENLAPEAKLIVLSNQDDNEIGEKVKEYNVDGFIIKALSTPSEVVNKVNEIYNESK